MPYFSIILLAFDKPNINIIIKIPLLLYDSNLKS